MRESSGAWYQVRYQEESHYHPWESWSYISRSWDTFAEAERAAKELTDKGHYVEIVLSVPMILVKGATECDC